MKVTKEFLRGEIARIQCMVPRIATGSAEEHLIQGIQRVIHALTAIELTGCDTISPNCLPKDFALETNPIPPIPTTFKDLEPDEDNPVRLWAEIWKLRSELRGPDNFETWRDAAVDEKVKRLAVQRELVDLQDKVRELGQSVGMTE